MVRTRVVSSSTGPEGITRREGSNGNSCKVKTAGVFLVDGLLARRAPPARLDRRPAGIVARRLARLPVPRSPVREQAQRSRELVPGGRELVHEPLRPLAVG